MVELALKALMKSTLGILPQEWHESQANISRGQLPEEHYEKHLKGSFLVWTNILERLVNGVFAEDSDRAFVDWLADYRKHLERALSQEDGKSNPYIRGQVEAFNHYLKRFAETTKADNKVYQEKVRNIKRKKEELDALESDLEGHFWAPEGNEGT